MNKLVYLFELDSIRNSPEEIIAAQNALFNEIIINGNRVAVTFNQIADSPTFKDMLHDAQNYKSVLELFATGTLKISRYKSEGKICRTAAQYLLKSAKKNQSGGNYHFSILPLDCENREKYNKDIWYAFEYYDPNWLVEQARKSNVKEEKELYEYLSRYVKLILDISQKEIAYNPANENYYKFSEIMRTVCEHYIKSSNVDINKAAHVLSDIFSDLSMSADGKNENRSEWLNSLGAVMGIDVEIVQLCEGIIHMCYNFTLENSIKDCDRQYETIEDEMFFDCFERRLSEWLAELHSGLHRLLSRKLTINARLEKYRLFKWKTAARIIEAIDNLPFGCRNSGLNWWLLVSMGIIKRLITIPIFALGFIIVEKFIGFTIGFGASLFSQAAQQYLIFDSLLIIAAGILSSFVSSRCLKLPDIVDSFMTIFDTVYDLWVILRFKTKNTKRIEQN